MPATNNKTLNERWIDAFNARDWAAEAALRTPDFQAHMPGIPGPLTSQAWAGFMSVFCTAFPDGRIQVEDAIAEAGMVASRWVMTGTHNGDFQGVPPTGRPVTMRGIDFSRIEGGRIAEHWAQLDLLAVMAQIGALPPPQSNEVRKAD